MQYFSLNMYSFNKPYTLILTFFSCEITENFYFLHINIKERGKDLHTVLTE